MTELDNWLSQATRTLARDSASLVRAEIQEHYESARDAAVANGATAEEASGLALRALGDAKTANRQYRRVLLTAAEARVLRDGNREAFAVCSRPWLKWMLTAVPVGAVGSAAVLFSTGHAA